MTTDPDPIRPRRRRLSLSLRGLMVVVLVLAVVLGWRVNKAREQRRRVEAIREHRGFVAYDWEFVDDAWTPRRSPWAPAWVRGAIGDEYFQEVVFVTFETSELRPDRIASELKAFPNLRFLELPPVRDPAMSDATLAAIARDCPQLEDIGGHNLDGATDRSIAPLAGMPRLRKLWLGESLLTDDGLRILGGLSHLEQLWVTSGRFTDRGLANLRHSTSLKSLALYTPAPSFTDAGLANLSGLKNLEVLCLSGALITDAGLKELEPLASLNYLGLLDSPASDAGFDRLEAAVPKLTTIFIR